MRQSALEHFASALKTQMHSRTVHPIRKTNCHFVSKLYLEANETMTEEEKCWDDSRWWPEGEGSGDEQHFSENPTIHRGQQPAS